MKNITEHDKAVLIDIDGTITYQRHRCWGSNDVIPGVAEKIKKLRDDGWYVVMWTGRSWDDFHVTKDMLDNNGIEYDEIVCGKPVTTRMVIIDDKDIDVIRVKRNAGLVDINI